MAPTVGVVALWFQQSIGKRWQSVFYLKMRKNLVNDLLVFDTTVRRIGDDLYGAYDSPPICWRPHFLRSYKSEQDLFPGSSGTSGSLGTRESSQG
jgi:hypothetical protein